MPGIPSAFRFGRRVRVGDLGDIGASVGLRLNKYDHLQAAIARSTVRCKAFQTS